MDAFTFIYVCTWNVFKFLAIKKNLKKENYEINPLIILMNWPILAATWERWATIELISVKAAFARLRREGYTAASCSTVCAISSTKSKAFSLTSEFSIDSSFSNWV